MTHRLSIIDRIIVGLVGLAAVAAGAWAIAWALGVDVGLYPDFDLITSFVASRWYGVALIVVTIAAVVAGIWLISANLRRHNFNRLGSPASSATGEIVIATNSLAKAIAGRLAEHPDVTSVEARTSFDRGERTLEITVHAEPQVRVQDLLEFLETSDAQVHAALPDMDLSTRYLIHLQPVR